MEIYNLKKHLMQYNNIKYFNRFFYVNKYYDVTIDEYIWRFWLLGFYFDTGKN
jgi:hypothetical protein